ncbi:hypothetical protein Patl1_26726 [Pistacia atlantica]|uniref:Uncharacterized protein n=1 Tax=Pistacia atlantica TaxID=434234 RepID=A0ACC1B394_9ROSI|nr:hypothetical protein Patl1_26726 [Pistacia atlantica]
MVDVSVVGTVAQKLGESARLKLSYLCNYNSNFEELKKEVDRLRDVRANLLSTIERAQSRGEQIERDVERWLKNVEEFIHDATMIIEDFERRAENRCCKGLCPDLTTRYRLNKKAVKELKAVSGLLKDRNFDRVSYDARILPVGLFPKKLKRYKIFIGDEWDWYDKYEYKRTLKLKLNTNIGLENEIIMQLKEIEELYLDEVQGVKNVLYDLDAGGFPKLKHLSVQNNPYIWRIVDSVEWLPCDAFPLLESLFLRSLINLEKICHGELTATSFFNVRMIKVRNCDKLRDFLSISVLKGLPKLHTFELIKCKNMEEIFTTESEGDVNYSEVIDEIDFYQLRFLTLKFLPRLTSFYHEVKTYSAVQNTHKELTTDKLSDTVILEDGLDTPMPFFSRKVG